MSCCNELPKGMPITSIPFVSCISWGAVDTTEYSTNAYTKVLQEHDSIGMTILKRTAIEFTALATIPLLIAEGIARIALLIFASVSLITESGREKFTERFIEPMVNCFMCTYSACKSLGLMFTPDGLDFGSKNVKLEKEQFEMKAAELGVEITSYDEGGNDM